MTTAPPRPRSALDSWLEGDDVTDDTTGVWTPHTPVQTTASSAGTPVFYVTHGTPSVYSLGGSQSINALGIGVGSSPVDELPVNNYLGWGTAVTNPFIAIGMDVFVTGTLGDAFGGLGKLHGLITGANYSVLTHATDIWTTARINSGNLESIWHESETLADSHEISAQGDLVATNDNDEIDPGTIRSQRALVAIRDLSLLLDAPLEDIAALGGFSKRTLHYWESGHTTPHASTVRHLLDVHAFVASLVRSIGRSRAQSWLGEREPDGRVRRDFLGTEDGVALLARNASGIIFERPPLPAVEMIEEFSLDDENSSIINRDRSATAAAPRPRRPRRPRKK